MMSILIGFICLLLAGFLWCVPSRRKMPNRFLAVFLILTALELSAWLWVGSHNHKGALNGLLMALGKLQMPVFFGFFMASCYSDFRLRKHDLLHLLPFLFGLFLILPGNQLPWGGPETGVAITDTEHRLNAYIPHILYYGYMVAVLRLLWHFRTKFKAHHAGGRSEVLVWLSQLAAASLFAHTLILIRDGLTFALSPQTVLIMQMVSALIALGITTWIALKSLLQPDLFRDVDRRLTALSHGPSAITRPDADQLLRFMETEKPYLNADLNLETLAHETAMTPREVSELINQTQGLHFFDFINGYRIRHAQTLLRQTPSQSVLEILYASGFNSKSSFNTAFKKQVGLTPTQYRRQSAAPH